MNWRTTVILAVLAIGLGAYLKYYDINKPSTREAAEKAKNVLDFQKDKIDGITIQNGDDTIDLRKVASPSKEGDTGTTSTKWRLEAPIKDQADSTAIDTLLGDLENWQKDATISSKEIEADKNKLGEYGLNKPKLRLKLSGKDAPPEIWFGKDAAFENKMYVRFENSKEAYLANQSVRKAIEKKADDFRDKRLTDLNTTQVFRVLLKTPAGEMELEKKNDHWEIAKPLRARADDQKVADLIAQVTTAQIQQFVADDRGDLNPYGLATPRGSVTLFRENDKEGQMLQIGSSPEKQKDQVYVRFSSRSFVYTLPKKIEEILNTKPNDLRDRHLARIDQKILDRITIDAPGKGKIVLGRKSEAWAIVSRNNAPANSTEAQRLIDTISNEQVTRFVEDVASDLPKYGLDKPQLTITFSSFASENTAETAAGEKPFASIAFGKVEGNDVYARVGDEPFVVAVRRTLLDQIATDPSQWQDLAIYNFKPDQIHRLTITTDKSAGRTGSSGGEEVSLVRGPKNEWTVAKGTGSIEQPHLQTLLTTLSTLHAGKWMGPAKPEHGLDKPQLVIAFTTSPDDKATQKLAIGGPTADGNVFARAGGHEGVFTISLVDANVLRGALLQMPTPTPAASPSGSPAPAVSPALSATPR